jgi:hypothetical protein
MTHHDFAHRAVLGALLAAHRTCSASTNWSPSFPRVPRVREAMRVLVDNGLVTRLGDRVGCSRAAVRFDVLAPISSARAS